MNKLSKIKIFIKSKLDSPQSKTFEGYYNSGVDAFDRKDYEKAVKFFKLAIAQKDVRPQVYYNLGLTYQSTKDYDLAIASYKKFLETNSEDYDGLYNIALTYFSLSNYPKAIMYFEKCLKMKNEEDVIKALVLAYLSNNEIQTAEEFAQNIFETNKNRVDLYYEIAKIFESKNPHNKDFTLIDKAIEMYSKIIEQNAQYFDAYLSKSICYAKKGEWTMSVEFCDKALGIKPDSYLANGQMGIILYCCDETQKAIDYFEIAIKLKPEGDYKVYSNLAYAYEKIGQSDKAIKIFTQLIKKFPQFPAKDEIKNHLRVLKAL